MTGATLFCFLTIVSLGFVSAEDKYPDRYDNVNVQEVIQNRRLLLAYIKCVLEKGTCTNEGRELKSHIKEALENQCRKCTDAQRRGTRTVIAHLINHEPDNWKQLVEKYDPQRKYTLKYEQELKTVKA